MSADKTSGSPPLNIEKCSVVLLDVAGTTTSINFIKDTLFPFVINKAEEFFNSNWEDDKVEEAVKLLAKDDSEVTKSAAIELVKSLTEKESDNEGLKTIQGLIYKKFYESGDLKAHVFSDVPAAFEKWSKTYKLAIYSTGSVDSQKLLYAHSTEGDLSTHIAQYFDLSAGAKTESESYKNIAKQFNVETKEVVFLTDNPEEAKAAKKAEMVAVLVSREGNAPISEDLSKDFTVISSFADLVFENPAKRKTTEDEAVSTEEPPSKIPKTDKATIEDKTEKLEPDSEVKPATEEQSMEVDAAPAEGCTKMETETNGVKEETSASSKTEAEKETKVEVKDTEKKEIKATEDKCEEQVKETEPKETTKTDTVVEVKGKEGSEMETDGAICDKELIDSQVKKDEVEEKMESENTTNAKGEKTSEVEEKKESESSNDNNKTNGDVKITNDNSQKENVEATKTEEAEIEAKKDNVNEEVSGEKIEVEVKEIVKAKEETSQEKIEVEVETGKKLENMKKVEKDKIEENATTMINVKEKDKDVEEKSDSNKKEEKNKVVQDDVTDNKIEGSTKVTAQEVSKKEITQEESNNQIAQEESKKETVPEEDKVEVAADKEMKNGSSDKENGSVEEKPASTEVEKENKSELANGIDNGSGNEAVTKNGDDTGDTNAKESSEEVDIKVKKVEESTDSAPVSVEA